MAKGYPKGCPRKMMERENRKNVGPKLPGCTCRLTYDATPYNTIQNLYLYNCSQICTCTMTLRVGDLCISVRDTCAANNDLMFFPAVAEPSDSAGSGPWFKTTQVTPSWHQEKSRENDMIRVHWWLMAKTPLFFGIPSL